MELIRGSARLLFWGGKLILCWFWLDHNFALFSFLGCLSGDSRRFCAPFFGLTTFLMVFLVIITVKLQLREETLPSMYHLLDVFEFQFFVLITIVFDCLLVFASILFGIIKPLLDVHL